jgi:hypothetical protein
MILSLSHWPEAISKGTHNFYCVLTLVYKFTLFIPNFINFRLYMVRQGLLLVLSMILIFIFKTFFCLSFLLVPRLFFCLLSYFLFNSNLIFFSALIIFIEKKHWYILITYAFFMTINVVLIQKIKKKRYTDYYLLTDRNKPR